MQQRPLGHTGLSIAPVVFGGNVFGWTADKRTSFDLLDRFTGAGFNAIDTANSYQTWVPGNTGMSETVIGEWMSARTKRNDIVLITKVGSDIGQGKKDLSATHIATAVEDSLRRLQTDRIDVYFSHWHDPATSYAETLGAYDRLIKAGKVRAIGASNHDATQLKDALTIADTEGLPRYGVLQPEYNLMDRASFDGPLRDLAMAENIGVITYFALARGFLTGKYRSKDDLGQSPRGGSIDRYLTARGFAILGALDVIAAKHGVKQADIALAWVIARDGVTAPIASATSLQQLESLINGARLNLDPEDIAELDRLSGR